MHERLILAMQNCPPRDSLGTHKKVRVIGGKMVNLRDLRTGADYHREVIFRIDDARAAIEISAEVLRLMDEIDPPTQ